MSTPQHRGLLAIQTKRTSGCENTWRGGWAGASNLLAVVGVRPGRGQAAGEST
jgi:hypothetical protein